MNDTFYDILATRYDILQSDMDCRKWADYISRLIEEKCRSGSEIKRIVDLGCGTGSVDVILAEKGYDITGIDNAEAMLEIASAKENADKITWVLHDITDFEMDDKVDCFLSLLDTMDHIMSKTMIRKIMRNVSSHLLPGGLFIFDVITEKHLKETLGDNIFYQDYYDFLLLWINHYDSKSKKNTAELTFFESDDSGKYDRYDGELVERFYPEEFFVNEAAKAGLKHRGTYGELVKRKPGADEERIFLVFEKK